MDKEEWKTILKKCFGREKDERWHSIAMLIIFFIVILILTVFIRTSPTIEETNNPVPSPTSQIENPSPPEEVQDLQKELEANSLGNYSINYSYLASFEENGKKELITGRRLDDKEIFTLVTEEGSNDYAKLSGNYLIKKEETYQLTDSPSEHLIYTDISTLGDMLEAELPEIQGNQYTYIVPNQTLIENYYADKEDINTDITPGNNTIVLTITDGVIQTIDLDFSSLHTELKKEPTTFHAKIELNAIGETEDFTIKLY